MSDFVPSEMYPTQASLKRAQTEHHVKKWAADNAAQKRAAAIPPCPQCGVQLGLHFNQDHPFPDQTLRWCWCHDYYEPGHGLLALMRFAKPNLQRHGHLPGLCPDRPVVRAGEVAEEPTPTLLPEQDKC